MSCKDCGAGVVIDETIGLCMICDNKRRMQCKDCTFGIISDEKIYSCRTCYRYVTKCLKCNNYKKTSLINRYDTKCHDCKVEKFFNPQLLEIFINNKRNIFEL